MNGTNACNQFEFTWTMNRCVRITAPCRRSRKWEVYRNDVLGLSYLVACNARTRPSFWRAGQLDMEELDCDISFLQASQFIALPPQGTDLYLFHVQWSWQLKTSFLCMAGRLHETWLKRVDGLRPRDLR
jgi:hypothetical protein